jgi:hypothetical protein
MYNPTYMCREVRIRLVEGRRKILNIWLIRDICKGNWKVCQAQTRAKKRKTEIAKALSLHFVISFDFNMAITNYLSLFGT